MPRMLRLLFVALIRSVRSRRRLLLENLALRQQLAILAQRHPQPRFSLPDRLFWVTLRRRWPGWRRALFLVQPDTILRWHRAGFRLYWNWNSRKRVRVGRKEDLSDRLIVISPGDPDMSVGQVVRDGPEDAD